MTIHPKLIALLTFLLFFAACGDDNGADTNQSDHPHYDKCTTSCAAIDDCADEELHCVDTCLARTQDLEGSCATCVAERFYVDYVCTTGSGSQEAPDDLDDEGQDGSPSTSEESGSGGSCGCTYGEGTVSRCEDFCT